jgi:hypothetical protein
MVSLNRFLFAKADPTKLSYFRIITGVILIIGVVNKRNADIADLFLLKFAWIWEIYEHIIVTDFYFLISCLCIFLFILGLFPKWIHWFLLFILTPLIFLDPGHFRSFFLMLFLLLCLSFVHHSEKISIHKTIHPKQPIKLGPIWPIRLIQISLSLLYFVNALAKSTPEYLNGEVLVGLSEKMPNFVYTFSDGSVPFLGFQIPVSFAAWSVVIIEYFLSFGFWIKRLLIPTVIIGLSFHLLLTFYIDIHLLHLTSLYLYFSFIFFTE